MDPISIALTPARKWIMGAISLTVAIAIIGLAFGLQHYRSQSAQLDLKLDAETKRADDAEETLELMTALRNRAEDASAADQDRVRQLEGDLAKQKETIDELERKLGATRVTALTRAHLSSVRNRQRP